MKFTGKLKFFPTANGVDVLIHIPQRIDIDPEKEYAVEIKKPRKCKTQDMNAYVWVLSQKIAERLSRDGSYHSKEDVYRTAIRDCGSYQIVPVKTSLLPRWQEIWQSKGIGWLSESIGSCKRTEGYSNVICYYGSSAYDRDEMERLISCLIDEAQTLGVPTKPQEEIDSLLQEWGDKNETE